jgi:hypothetical protein
MGEMKARKNLLFLKKKARPPAKQKNFFLPEHGRDDASARAAS